MEYVEVKDMLLTDFKLNKDLIPLSNVLKLFKHKNK